MKYLALFFSLIIAGLGQDLVRPKMPTTATLTSNPPTNNRVWYEYAVALEGKVANQTVALNLANSDLAASKKQVADLQASLANAPALVAIMAKLTTLEQSGGAIKMVIATAVTASGTLSWDYIGSTAVGFKIERSTDGVAFTSLATLADSKARSYVDKPLTPGTYWWRVRTIEPNQSNSAPSNTPTATVP